MADFEKYETLCSSMKQKGYQKEEHILSAAYTYGFGMLAPIPFMVLYGVLYYLRWGDIHSALRDYSFVLVLIGLIIVTVIHEGIHGIVWSIFCKNGFKNSIKFGIHQGMPFCHCDEALEKKGYIAGTLAPICILGFVFVISSMLFASASLFMLGLLNLLSAGGDLLIVQKAARLNNVLIIDHPNKPGFVAFKK